MRDTENETLYVKRETFLNILFVPVLRASLSYASLYHIFTENQAEDPFRQHVFLFTGNVCQKVAETGELHGQPDARHDFDTKCANLLTQFLSESTMGGG